MTTETNAVEISAPKLAHSTPNLAALLYLRNCKGCAALRFWRWCSITAIRGWRARGFITRSLWGWAGRQSLLRALRLSDHVDSAGGAREAALLSQLLCAPGAAHLAGLCAGAGGGLSECAVVYRPQRAGRNQGRALAGLHLFRAESFSPGAAAGHRAHLVAGHRGAVLLSVGAAGAVSAPALDAGRRC